MNTCDDCGYTLGSSWWCKHCEDWKSELVSRNKTLEERLIEAANIAAKGERVGIVRGCAANDHHFVRANDDALRCDGCGVKIRGENLAALGFVHRSQVEPPKHITPIDDGLSFLREPMADSYMLSLYPSKWGYEFKVTIPDEPPPAVTVDVDNAVRFPGFGYEPQFKIEQAPIKTTEAPCRTCNKPNDLGVKVCWCCGNAP